MTEEELQQEVYSLQRRLRNRTREHEETKAQLRQTRNLIETLTERTKNENVNN